LRWTSCKGGVKVNKNGRNALSYKNGLILNGAIMFKKYFFHLIFLLAFLWCNVMFADETEENTTNTSGGNQIIVSPINILLDLGESGAANALVLDKDGNPVKGEEIQIIPQDNTKVVIESNSIVTNEFGYVHISILGKQQGDTVVTVSDGVISSQINISIRNLIHYGLPYFYGDMQLNLINPYEGINYVKVQFYENSDRALPPVIIRLEGKEMKSLKLSGEIDVTLSDGWVEIFSSEVVFGGVWTNKGYVPLDRIEE
jgi:hypothetical protein